MAFILSLKIAKIKTMKHKCLIVEDSVFIREIYKLCLAETEFEIVGESGDGKDALMKIQTLQPDLLILDIVLPEIQGFDVLSRTHQLSPNTRAIVVSSLSDNEYKEKAKNLGAIFYLDKPFKKDHLLEALRDAVHSVSGEKHG